MLFNQSFQLQKTFYVDGISSKMCLHMAKQKGFIQLIQMKRHHLLQIGSHWLHHEPKMITTKSGIDLRESTSTIRISWPIFRILGSMATKRNSFVIGQTMSYISETETHPVQKEHMQLLSDTYRYQQGTSIAFFKSLLKC